MTRTTVELESEDERTEVERTADNLNIGEDEAADLLKGLDELRTAQGVVFQVYRTEPQEKQGFCTEYPASLFTVPKLSREWGPGTYRIRVKGEGGRFMRGGGTIKVAATEMSDVSQRAPEQSSVQDMLALLKADREKSAERLKEWAAILAPIAAPILANLFSSKKESVADMVGALAALKQLEPPAPKPPDALAEIEKVGALLERARELAGGDKSSTGSTWVDVLRDALGGVKDLIASGAASKMLPALRPPGMIPNPNAIPMIPLVPTQGPSVPSGTAPGASSASVPPQPASPTSAAASDTASSTTPGIAGDPLLAMIPWLRATLDSLCFQASRNKDPNLYAEVTLDNLPDGADVRQLLEFLEEDDWWTKLQTFAPQVIPYAGWFGEFRTSLVSEIKKLIAGPDGEGS